MDVCKTQIDGVVVVNTARLGDTRGWFARLFCTQETASVFGDRQIVQINQSRTHSRGAVRGLHFQHPPHAEMKLVRCLQGRVWDVAVDLRAGSPTFLAYYAIELSAANMRMMVIPEGCAHGFQVLEENSELLYLHTAAYARESEGGVRYDDPAVNVEWPLDVTDISERDRGHSFLPSAFQGIYIQAKTAREIDAGSVHASRL